MVLAIVNVEPVNDKALFVPLALVLVIVTDSNCLLPLVATNSVAVNPESIIFPAVTVPLNDGADDDVP